MAKSDLTLLMFFLSISMWVLTLNSFFMFTSILFFVASIFNLIMELRINHLKFKTIKLQNEIEQDKFLILLNELEEINKQLKQNKKKNAKQKL